MKGVSRVSHCPPSRNGCKQHCKCSCKQATGCVFRPPNISKWPVASKAVWKPYLTGQVGLFFATEVSLMLFSFFFFTAEHQFFPRTDFRSFHSTIQTSNFYIWQYPFCFLIFLLVTIARVYFACLFGKWFATRWYFCLEISIFAVLDRVHTNALYSNWWNIWWDRSQSFFVDQLIEWSRKPCGLRRSGACLQSTITCAGA